MRVLIVNSVCGVGSTGRICTDLYDELVSNGHECCIAYGRGTASEQYNTYKIGNKFDNYWHVLETRLFDNHGFASRKTTKKFLDFVDEFSPDIVNLHNIHGYYLNLGFLLDFFSKRDIRIVWTLHDMWLFSGHSAYIEYLSNGVLPQKNSSFRERFEYPASITNRSRKNFLKKMNLVLNSKDIVFVTPSNWLKKVAKDSFLSKFSIITIHNGINLSNFFSNRSANKSNKPKEILAVANIWDKRKGLEDVISFSEELPSKEYHFTVVGKTFEEIPSNIKYIEHTSNVNELSKLYRQSDIFINPTYKDNFPTTNIEAQACGTPVITYDTGGSGESILKDTGVVIPTGDKKAFLKSIQLLNKNNIVSDACQKNAEKYSKEVMAKKYMELFCHIINGKA